MPELEGQAATQREYMSGATPSDCEETNWHSVGLQKMDFGVARFISEVFRHSEIFQPPHFHAYSFTGTAVMRDSS